MLPFTEAYVEHDKQTGRMHKLRQQNICNPYFLSNLKTNLKGRKSEYACRKSGHQKGKNILKTVRKKIHENGGKELKLTPNTN